MPMLPGKKNVGENIREFHKGPTYAHTEEKFGKKDADKQAIAASLHAAGESNGDAQKEHRAAIAKMHPEHLHRLVQHAASGKAGLEMQQMAQQAMQGPTENQEPDGDEAMPPRRSMFSGDNDQDDQPAAQAPTGSMFSGGR